MDPEKIRENIRRLSRIGEPGSPGGPASESRSGPAKPLWEPLQGDDLKDIEAEREKLKRLRSGTRRKVQDQTLPAPEVAVIGSTAKVGSPTTCPNEDELGDYDLDNYKQG